MTNWEDIHRDFVKEAYKGSRETYQQIWEQNNLTYQDAQEWIQAGFKPKDYWKIKKWKNQNLTTQEAKLWNEKGLKLNDYIFVSWLKSNNYQPYNLPKTIEELREEYTQNWLNINYPNKQQTKKIKTDLSEDLHSSLIISDYPNLEEINIQYQHNLTNLQINNCPNLRELDIRNSNKLTNLILPQSNKLEKLSLWNNSFNQDLSFLKDLVNLKTLYLGNNKFYGSLEFLKDLDKLETLNICDTDIDSGLEYLSESVKWFYCSADKRKDAKVKDIYNSWMKSFFAHEKKTEEIDKFIKKSHQLNASSKNLLEWIPYEKLTGIKYLAKGGFSKVYKAKWNDKKVVLKNLNDSIDIKKDFSQEVANYKLFSSIVRIVGCFGISQDPQTKNYIMVMDYIKDGDLRQFLQNNQLDLKSKLIQLWRIADGSRSIHKQNLTHRDFHSGNILNRKDKVRGIDDIYCYITDLGLCRPANVENKAEVYGQIPYVAPEILGKSENEPAPYTQASDIYSFGVVVYELLCRLSSL